MLPSGVVQLELVVASLPLGAFQFKLLIAFPDNDFLFTHILELRFDLLEGLLASLKVFSQLLHHFGMLLLLPLGLFHQHSRLILY
jgi:hypothetical protein